MHGFTPADFHAAEGVDDWRVMYLGACTQFLVDDYATAVALTARAGEIAVGLGHAPHLQTLPDRVVIRSSSGDFGALSPRDVEFAVAVSAAARDLGARADPEHVQNVQVGLYTADPEAAWRFWTTALGYEMVGEEGDLLDPARVGPAIQLFPREAHDPRHQHFHVDVGVPHDQAEARVQAILDAGGRMLGDRFAPAWWSLIDTEGNVVDIATWQGREFSE